MNPDDPCFFTLYYLYLCEKLPDPECRLATLWQRGITYYGTRAQLEKIRSAFPQPLSLVAASEIIKERPFSENLIYRYDGAGRQLGLRKNAKRN